MIVLADKYLQVTVDIPISRQRSEFVYLPEEGKKAQDYEFGQPVRVPFGSRNVSGYITDFVKNPDLDEEKIKPVSEVLTHKPGIDAKLLETLKRLSYYYHSSLQSFIRTALPTDVRGERRSASSRIHYLLLEEYLTEEFAELQRKAPAQARVIQVLRNADKDILPATEILKRADTGRSTLYSLEEKKLVERKEVKVHRRPDYSLSHSQEANDSSSGNIELNSEQKEVLQSLMPSLFEQRADVNLLHGVTGSGKTEIYLRLVKKCLQQDRSAIILVPEISLTPYLVDFFYGNFPGKIAVLHSRLAAGERRDEWHRIKSGEARLVIGARSAVFAPIRDPGLLIIDEEHENSYKQNNTPYYHARGAAVIRSQIESFPVVLGSATPSLESYYFSQDDKYSYQSLKSRAGPGKMPEKKLVDMREEVKEGNYGLFSRSLKDAIEKRLERDEQILIFLNRRGFASFMLCQECGDAIKCKNCDITLTYHKKSGSLKCHYCDYRQAVPDRCPACGSDLLKEFGAGTERLEERLAEIYPGAEISRMDRDTTGRKNSHRDILTEVEQGNIDILVGTQMIAKGHDFHNITLVGVLGVDLILNLPDFRSSERTYQLLTQVAGRAGRGKKKGEVIVQTFSPDHYALQAMLAEDIDLFYEEELKLRSRLNYPPFSRMVRFIFKTDEDSSNLKEFAAEVRKYLHINCPEKMDYFGPNPAPLERLKGRVRWHLLLYFSSVSSRIHFMKKFLPYLEENITGSVNYSVDVDPLSML